MCSRRLLPLNRWVPREISCGAGSTARAFQPAAKTEGIE
jgi:hypothetical protein